MKSFATYVLLCVTSVMSAAACGTATPPSPPTPSTEPIEALPEHLIYLYATDADAAPTDVQRQLFANSRRWEPGRTLKVCMFGGNEIVGTLIRQGASEWNQYSSIKFDFGPADRPFNCLDPGAGFFQVRIGFSERGYWSAVGNDSERRIDAHAPSMNFDGFNRLYSPGRFAATDVLNKADRYHVATIKHEFGHALALLHEHQNPKLGCFEEIKWDGPDNVYTYFGGPPNYWSPDLVKRNLGFIANTDPDYASGASDPKSIMMYALPAQVFRKGKASPCMTTVNYDISAKDRQVVGTIYGATSSISTAANDSDLKAATVLLAAAPSTERETADVTRRILFDLQSDDTFVRRNARARLADLMTKLPSSTATELIKTAEAGPYRLQLGLAVGLNNAGSQLELSPDARSALVDLAKTTKDATLKRELGTVLKR